MADAEKCAHEGCNCAQAEDSDYCSPYCESAGEGELTELKCDCGHAGCATM